MTDATPPPLIACLLAPDAYPHSVESIELRETHISWVLLTGQFAYKIKKPVDLGFVDFTTLDRRQHFCEQEVHLNRRLAPEIYLDVVPIVATPGGVAVSPGGEPVEFAVRMRQFDERDLASRRLADQRLLPADIDGLAAVLADFHEAVARPTPQRWGTAAQVSQPVLDNFADLRPLIDDASRLCQLDRLEDWSRKACDRLASTFEQRRESGFVRECHGDLHLGNIVRWQGTMTPFDCIDFNPAFRWIDVMNEVAFLVMDLDDHNRSDFGWRLLNGYLEQTGDYLGLSVLPFYLVYRAIVRAKVDALRLHQSGLSSSEQRRLTTEWHEYLDLAEWYTRTRQVSLTITHGVSGSGKTTSTQGLVQQCGVIRIRSDVERKRLFGRKATEDATGAVAAGIYSPEATERTYARLHRCTQGVLESGFPVIVDATFLRRDLRQQFRSLATGLGVPFQILPFGVDKRLSQERIEHRRHHETDASDATTEVLKHQLQTLDPLSDDELPDVIDAKDIGPTYEPSSRE